MLISQITYKEKNDFNNSEIFDNTMNLFVYLDKYLVSDAKKKR